MLRARDAKESRGSEADQTAREVLDRSKALFLALLSLVFFVRKGRLSAQNHGLLRPERSAIRPIIWAFAITSY